MKQFSLSPSVTGNDTELLNGLSQMPGLDQEGKTSCVFGTPWYNDLSHSRNLATEICSVLKHASFVNIRSTDDKENDDCGYIS